MGLKEIQLKDTKEIKLFKEENGKMIELKNNICIEIKDDNTENMVYINYGKNLNIDFIITAVDTINYVKDSLLDLLKVMKKDDRN